MRFNLEYAVSRMPLIFKYAGMSMNIAIVSMFFTVIFSLLITIIRYYRIKVLHQIVNVYIDIFRGTPLLVQLFFIYFGLPQISPVFVSLTGYQAAIIGMTLNAAAYMTEDMRGALESVPKGQIEAGLSVGMTNLQVMRHIIVPQATRVALPVLGNEFISLVKNSSMAFTIGVRDIMAEATLLGNSSAKFFECYLDAFIVYFVISKIITILQKYLEKKMNLVGGGHYDPH